MAYFNRSDLNQTKYRYAWNAKEEADNPNVTGFPDSTMLDRQEGYEMLGFINTLARASKWESKASGQKTERLIREHLPGEIRSRNKIRQWLIDNWSKY